MLAITVGAIAGEARAQSPTGARTLTFRFRPTKHAQIAIWLESADASHFANVRLTEATCRYGIGNRPGASQMNSGYHWPYGRREGVLPVWAHRRAAAPGATLFPRVIFQNRPEGYVERIVEDSTPDPYFCLSFNTAASRRDGLDAVSCASAFNSDKGRFLTAADTGYAEPFEAAGVGAMRPLDTTSLYPPRSGVFTPLPGEPNLDAISMPTPAGDTDQVVTFAIPDDFPNGDAFAFLEINTEGDYNASYDPTSYPTPTLPAEAWDNWAETYGYPFRGQPSIVFKVALNVGTAGVTSTSLPIGYGSLDGIGPAGGDINPIDATITQDPSAAPGSGLDRLRVATGGYRLRVETALGPADGAADGGMDAQTDAGPTSGNACIVNPDCPPGQYCGVQNRCTFDCLKDIDCPGSGTCSSLGMCVTRSSAGCGCELGTAPSASQSALGLALLWLSLAVARRRRRSEGI